MDHCIDLTFGSGVQNTALVVITYKTFLAPKHNWNSANPYQPQFCCSGSSNDPKPRAYLPEFLSQGHEVTSHEVTSKESDYRLIRSVERETGADCSKPLPY
ncbi:hypothetical protein LXG23DRAFT_33616 [Yarrowia lipolytica]|nr:hypothetical protein LXG23DRAFT_33616 [Yarrowia lipolytica]